LSDRNLILFVDDDALTRNVTTRVLEGAGFAVVLATTGLAGLELVRQHRPDLILLDVNLPDLSGVEVCRQIKADPALAHLFVVMASASQITSDQQSAGLEAGADGYIARPIANRELLARVEAFLRIKRVETALRQREAELQTALREKEHLITELKAALSEVKTLSGLLPICAGCKKVRDDQGFWSQVETYVSQHTDATFTHGLCPGCIAKYYPELAEETP
jgi:DNA-binding response OmpR family regulator